MNRTIEYFKVRLHKLEQRDATINKNIINKLRRQIRAMETGQE